MSPCGGGSIAMPEGEAATVSDFRPETLEPGGRLFADGTEPSARARWRLSGFFSESVRTWQRVSPYRAD